MTRRLFGSTPAALAITIALFALHPASAPAQQDAALDLPESTFRGIVECLVAGKEYVMPALACVDRGQGDEIAFREKMPLGDGNWDKVCEDKNDRRRLPADVIKRIATEKQIAPTGIRLLGAVFCHGPDPPDANPEAPRLALDLAGLDLPYSLVIDRSVVNGFIDARNLRVKGDFSFEHALILDTLRLNRANVDGSVYGRGSFIKELRVFDTHVAGTWQHRDSVIFSDAQYVRATIAGDLNVSGSAFSRLWIQSSRITGSLVLDNSEARCAYHIFASTVGYLAASHAGFGTVRTRQVGQPADFPWWNRAASGDSKRATRELFESAAIKKVVDTELSRINAASDESTLPGCDQTSGSAYLEFYVFDSAVDAAFCMTSFSWLTPKQKLPDSAHPVSIIALNGTRIEGNLIIDLWGNSQTEVAKLEPGRPEYELVTRKHKFEAIGLTARAFIHTFSDNAKPYFTYLDGLNFDRIHKATPACADTAVPGLASQVMLPSVNEVSDWLDKNGAPSSQPFMAFVKGFEEAGESTTPLRVKRMTVDLCTKTARWIPQFAKLCSGRGFDAQAEPESASAIAPSTGGPASAFGVVSATYGFFSTTAEIGTIAFNWVMFLVADHGLRPGKVVWSVIVVIGAFWLAFRYIFGVVAFEPKTKDGSPSSPDTPLGAPQLWPVTWLFLFDRLIPLYQIREEHYSIKRVFRRATPSEIKAGPRAPGQPPYQAQYFGWKFFVWPLDDPQLRHVEKWLAVLHVVGAALTVFLLAAINALVR